MPKLKKKNQHGVWIFGLKHSHEACWTSFSYAPPCCWVWKKNSQIVSNYLFYFILLFFFHISLRTWVSYCGVLLSDIVLSVLNFFQAVLNSWLCKTKQTSCPLKKSHSSFPNKKTSSTVKALIIKLLLFSLASLPLLMHGVLWTWRCLLWLTTCH